MKKDLYWHCTLVDESDEPCLGPHRVRAGETLRVEGEPFRFEHGFDAEDYALDAVEARAVGQRYALCRIALGGEFKAYRTGACATERTTLALLDVAATRALLFDFTRQVAADVAHLWEIPVSVRHFLDTGDLGWRADIEHEVWRRAWYEPAASDMTRAGAWAARAVAAILREDGPDVRAAVTNASRAAAWAASAKLGAGEEYIAASQLLDAVEHARTGAFQAMWLRQRDKLEGLALAAIANFG